MNILASLVLIAGGLVAIFYLRPKTQNNVTEIKYMQTKTVVDIMNMFKQMDETGLGNGYREFVELKGTIVSNNLVETPFSNRKVAYCESKVLQVSEVIDQYRDQNGNMRTRVRKNENEISSEKTSQEISLIDSSTNEEVILDVNGSGCNFEVPQTFNRFENKNNIGNYKYFNSSSWNKYDADTLGFKMVEKTIEPNQSLYVIGEAYRVGNKVHIGKPQDNKKPFIVTTKSEEDLVNNKNEMAKIELIGGIIAIVVGIIMFIMR